MFYKEFLEAKVFFPKGIHLVSQVIYPIGKTVVSLGKELYSCCSVCILSGMLPLSLMGKIMEMIEKLRKGVVLIHGVRMWGHSLLRMLIYHIIIEAVKFEYLLDLVEFLIRHSAFSVFYCREETGTDLKKISQFTLTHACAFSKPDKINFLHSILILLGGIASETDSKFLKYLMVNFSQHNSRVSLASVEFRKSLEGSPALFILCTEY